MTAGKNSPLIKSERGRRAHAGSMAGSDPPIASDKEGVQYEPSEKSDSKNPKPEE